MRSSITRLNAAHPPPQDPTPMSWVPLPHRSARLRWRAWSQELRGGASLPEIPFPRYKNAFFSGTISTFSFKTNCYTKYIDNYLLAVLTNLL